MPTRLGNPRRRADRLRGGGLDQIVTPLATECGGSGLVRHEWKQRQMPGALNGQPQSPLVFGADARPPAGFYLRPVRNESSDAVHILIIDVFDMVYTEGADSPPRSKAPPATPSEPTSSAPGWRPASWPSRWWCGHIMRNPPVKTSAFSILQCLYYLVEMKLN